MKYALRTAIIAVSLLALAPAGVFAGHNNCGPGDDSGEWPYLCLADNQPDCSSVLPANASFYGWGTYRCRTSGAVTCSECGTNGHSGCNPCKSYAGWTCNPGYVQSGGGCVRPCSPNQGNACTTCNACGACNSGSIQCNGSCSAGAPPLSACGIQPLGNFDAADCSAARGWSSDPDYSGAVSIHIYRDGAFTAAVTANQFYPGRGNVGWSWPIPVSQKDGLPHTLNAYAINVNAAGAPQGPNPLLAGSPKSITCSDPPTGTFTSATCGAATVTATGTATDAQGSPVRVSIYDGAAPGGTLLGSGDGPNFSIAFPRFTNGQVHTLYAYGRDMPFPPINQVPLTNTQAVVCAPTVTLSAAPPSVGFAGSTTLTWSNITNAVSCTGSPGGWFNPGTVVNGVGGGSASSGPLTSTTTFTLTCTNASGQPTMASTVVSVAAPPPTASVVNVTDTNYCTVGPGMVIDWKYESVARPIGAYQVQVFQGGTKVFDTGKTIKTAALPLPPVVQEVPQSPLSPWSVLRATILNLMRWMFGEEANACHGDCGYGGDGCQQACDEGGMGGLPWCIDPPGNGYGTGWDIGKRDSWCAGAPSCRETWRCYTDFGCNGGYYRCGDSCCQIATPPPCAPNQGQACQSSPNICGMRNSGTINCAGNCNASTPPNSSCPAPTCSANPTNTTIGSTVTATAATGVGPYTWNSGGGTPATGPGNPKTFTYGTTGAKTLTVTDTATGRTGVCSVTVCVANFGQACASAANSCGITTPGTYNCVGTCVTGGGVPVAPPPLSACPPPSCSANPASVNAGSPVTATGASGIPPYTWTSGGLPPTGSGNAYTMVFDATGTKTITVRDSNAKSGTCNVNVGASYTATGTVTTAQGGLPGFPGITFNTAYEIRVVVWDNGDQKSATVSFPYTTKPGPWPTADFTFSPDTPFAALPIQFTDASTNNPIGWTWDFGDSQGAAIQNPSHTYAAEGSYSVTLNATNAAGTCPVTKTLEANKALPRYREVRPGTQPTQKPEATPTRTPARTPRGNEQPPPPPPGGPNSDL